MRKINIAHNNYDIVFKNLASVFKGGGLEALGIEDVAEIEVAVDTEQPIIDINENRMDMVFQLKDKSFLHLEFQTTNKKADLSRFLIYDARLYETVRDTVSGDVKIRTIVVFGPEIGNAKSSIDVGSFTYSVENIYLDHMDGDLIFNDLTGKIESGQELSDADKVKLILNPLMSTKIKREERILHIIDFAKNIKEDKGYIIGAIIGLTNTIVSKEIQEKMLEVFRMTDAFRELEEQIEVKSHIKTRKEDIKRYLNSQGGSTTEMNELITSVDQINSKDTLDDLFDYILFQKPSLTDIKQKLYLYLSATK